MTNPLPMAVIGDGEITTLSGSRPYPTASINHVMGLAQIALAPALPLRALWIKPGSDVDLVSQEAHFWQPAPGWKVFATGQQFGGRISAASIRRDNVSGAARREIMIYADPVNRWAAGKDLLSMGPAGARVLLLRSADYEREMSLPDRPVHLQFSLASTANLLLQHYNDTAQRREWMHPLSEATLRTIPWPQDAAPLHVNRAFAQELRYVTPFVHVYDKNGAYLAACKRGFGTGEPEHVVSPNKALCDWVCQGKAVGLWCITARPPAITGDGRGDLPTPWDHSGEAPDHAWVYTPQIQAAWKLGWDVEIHEGHYWPDYHNVMCEWADHLWAARQHVKGSAVETMLKRSFVEARGIFRRPPGDSERIRWYHRPDWSGMIVSEHYCRQLMQIRTYQDKSPGLTGYLAVMTDKIAWVTDDPYPETAIPHILERVDTKGGYKHVGTWGGAEAREIIALCADGCTSGTLERHILKLTKAAVQ